MNLRKSVDNSQYSHDFPFDFDERFRFDGHCCRKTVFISLSLFTPQPDPCRKCSLGRQQRRFGPCGEVTATRYGPSNPGFRGVCGDLWATVPHRGGWAIYVGFLIPLGETNFAVSCVSDLPKRSILRIFTIAQTASQCFHSKKSFFQAQSPQSMRSFSFFSILFNFPLPAD